MKTARPKIEPSEVKEVTRRVQLELPEIAMTRLSNLKKRMEAASYAEVVKNALRIYAYMIEETDAGAVFQIKKSGKAQEFKIL